MVTPALQIIVDGDSNKVYGNCEKVTGKVTLVVKEQVQIKSLKVNFAGSCITKTSRSFHVNSNCDTTQSRNYFEEKVLLFIREKELVAGVVLTPKQYCWAFDFTFPQSTEQSYKRLIHGASYHKKPHRLPPSFQLKTDAPGGAAQISYFVQVKLMLGGSRNIKEYEQVLRLQYQPSSQTAAPRDAKTITSVLYGQIWMPKKEKLGCRRAFDKVFSRYSKSDGPRIVPYLSHPRRVAPGQHIALSLTLVNSRDPLNESQGECILDTLTVTLSTYSTTICGRSLNHHEDVVSKHITCIARTDINKTLRFGQTEALTSYFGLVDDVECVPSFKTYIITRRYEVSLSIGIKYNDETFAIKATTPLEILPRTPRALVHPLLENDDDVDTLPLYTPREPLEEFAPDYECIYSPSQTTSR